MIPQYDPPEELRPFCNLWKEKFTLAAEYKKKVFDKYAEVGRQYYAGPHDFVFDKEEVAKFGKPQFKMTFNKVYELVSLFGPILYHRNPTRVVTTRPSWKPSVPSGPPPGPPMQPGMPPMPPGPLSGAMAQMTAPDPMGDMQDALLRDKASLIEHYLNYTPNELDLKGQMRLAIDEALVKGRGTLWCQAHTPPQSQQKLVGSFFRTVDDLLTDPDHTSLDKAKWIARKCCRPAWDVEREYGLPPGYLKGTRESTAVAAATSNGTLNHEKKQGKTADLVEYYEVWSKMGMGVRLKPHQKQTLLGELSQVTEIFGDYVYLVICPSCPYPLNIPEQLVRALASVTPEGAQAFLSPPPFEPGPPGPNGEPPMLVPVPHPPEIQQQVDTLTQIRERVQWPIPLWMDDAWPVTCIDFRPLFDCSWPLNLLTPALGEQDFLDWAYSFLASKIKTTSRDFIAYQKGISDETLDTIEKGPDLTLIPLEGGMAKNISEQIQFLQHPQMNTDIHTVLQAIEKNFEKRTGLSEAMYGQTAHAYRSAAEAGMKGQMTQIRPDDMANIVEDAAGLMARKEAIAARLILKGADVAPIVGPMGATFWDQQVASQDAFTVVREFDIRVESGSAKKPNKDAQVQNTQDAAQFLLPFLQQMGQTTGNWGPLCAFIKDYAAARDWDVTKYDVDPASFMPPPPPPMPPGAPPQGPPQQGPPPPAA